MTKRVVCLSLLLLALCGVYAQSISQYEYWTDDDYTARSVVNAGVGDISLTVSTATLEAGVHFLNFRAKGTDGTWGNFYRYMYYIPTLKNGISGILGIEYWFDDDYSAVIKKNPSASEQLLTLSLDGLASGVHYFNCRSLNERGEYGCSVREMFYIPQTEVNNDAKIAKSEYWFDDDYSKRTILTTPNTELAFRVDVSNLSSGVHYFNYRAVDNKGAWGKTIRQAFYIAISDQLPTIGKIGYEYWLDDDTEHKVTGAGTSSEYAFKIDISPLDEGTHTFNFRAKDNLDQLGELFARSFVIDYSIPYLLGDVSCDGKVNVVDIVMLVKYLNDEVLPSSCDINKADMNKNGRINALDLDLLVKAIMGED